MVVISLVNQICKRKHQGPSEYSIQTILKTNIEIWTLELCFPMTKISINKQSTK